MSGIGFKIAQVGGSRDKQDTKLGVSEEVTEGWGASSHRQAWGSLKTDPPLTSSGPTSGVPVNALVLREGK